MTCETFFAIILPFLQKKLLTYYAETNLNSDI